MFNAELFDPDHWADVFQRSGAKYVVLTSKHHEGFALWPSARGQPHLGHGRGTPSKSAPTAICWAISPTRSAAQSVRMGIYYSLYEWYNPLWLSDKPRYVAEHMHPQFKDVVTRYKPSIIFSDGEWDLPSAEWRSPELLAWLFNESPCKDEVVINDRWGKDTRHKHGGYYTTEYTAGMSGMDHPWEESRGMGFSYGYNRAENVQHYRTGRELVLMLVDLVSRGGNLLLDIGPTADGRIPVIMEERLIADGRLAEDQRRGDLRHARLEEHAAVERGRDSQGRLQQGIHDALRRRQTDRGAGGRQGVDRRLLYGEGRRRLRDSAALARPQLSW